MKFILWLSVCRHIADGAFVWTDPWLPDPVSPFISTMAPLGLEILRIKDLFLPSSRSWNMEQITSMFEIRDVELIKKIQLGRFDCEDSWMWLGT